MRCAHEKEETVRSFLETSARFLEVPVRSRGALPALACKRLSPIEPVSGENRRAGSRI